MSTEGWDRFAGLSELLEAYLPVACPAIDERLEDPDSEFTDVDTGEKRTYIDALSDAIGQLGDLHDYEPWIVSHAGGGPQDIAEIGPYSSSCSHLLGIEIMLGSLEWRQSPEHLQRGFELARRPISHQECWRLQDRIRRERFLLLRSIQEIEIPGERTEPSKEKVETMVAMLMAKYKPESFSWTSKQDADRIGCDPSVVRHTQAWKRLRALSRGDGDKYKGIAIETEDGTQYDRPVYDPEIEN